MRDIAQGFLVFGHTRLAGYTASGAAVYSVVMRHQPDSPDVMAPITPRDSEDEGF
jgi:hypothetical protein